MSATSLLARASALGATERSVLDFLLGFAWCWPAPGSLLEPAGARPAPRVGEALFVTTDATGERGAVWMLHAGTRGAGRYSFAAAARQAISIAESLAGRDIPLNVDPDARGESRPHPLPAGTHGAHPKTVDGASLGLAAGLAAASRSLRTPVDPTYAALAALDLDGSTLAVGGLKSKIRALHEVAPRVTRLLVAPCQREEAEAAVAALGVQDLEVVPVGTLAAAVDRTFSIDPTSLVAAMPLEERIERAERLFELALHGETGLLGWRGIATLAGALREAGGFAPPVVRRLGFAEKVASRHAGATMGVLLGWPTDEELADLTDDVATTWLAHVVQSAADGAPEQARAYAARARSLLPEPRRRRPDHLKLLGAVGRAYAASLDYAVARECLREAFDGWVARYRFGECTHSLCELLRLDGIAGNPAQLVPLLEGDVARVLARPDIPNVSRAFVLVAAARASAQAREFARALVYLDLLAAHPTPTHLEEASHRWRARSLDGLGRTDDAARVRARIAPASTQAFLAALDSAAAEGPEALSAAARRLCERDPDAQRLWDRLGGREMERARRLGEESRY